MRVRWLAGAPALREALDDALARGGGGAVRIAERPGRRQLTRLTLAGGERVLVKRIRRASSRRPLRARLRDGLGLSPAAREWWMLRHLRGGDVPVPEPLALGRLGDGDAIVVTRYREGRPLREALARAGPAERRALARTVGDLVARLHAAGIVHRDLHAGNVRIGEDGPLLLDFQSARRSRSARRRRADLGALDHSLSGVLSRAGRARLLASALSLPRPFGPAGGDALRAVGRAALARGRARARSRTRRALAPGRRFARLDLGAWRGLRARDVPESVVRAALERAPGEGLALKVDGRSRVAAVCCGGRRLVVKTFPPRGPLRALADALRGSPARRAWLGGHGLAARRIGAARPVAFVERRVAFVPVASAVAAEDLSEWTPADAAPGAAPPGEVALALAGLARALHVRGAQHRDLKASHVLLQRDGDALRARLLDLEDVRFPRRIGERGRIAALAQLNASLPDAIPDACRVRAFRCYAAALPFRSRSAALARVARRSAARAHRWTGADCQLAWETTIQRK